MTRFDHYESARTLISEMAQKGHSTHAARLKSAMDAGVTGTEILMAMRGALVRISDQEGLDREISDRIGALLFEINRVLEQADAASPD